MSTEPKRQAPKESHHTTQAIADAAARVGVEVNTAETAQWLLAMSAADRSAVLAQDEQTGIFGHRVALYDFDASDLAYFRRMAQRVRVVKHPQIEAAIAIAGSAAQGKVQLFPGDNDFFERINIHAATLEQACTVLRDAIRATALRAFAEPDIVLVEVNFGVYPQAAVEHGSPRAAGDTMTWMPQDMVAGAVTVTTPDGAPLTIRWEDTQAGLGWTYLGWIVADREGGRIALASNMIDVTWQAPDGTLTSLDGAIDPFFQEIYLEPSELPVFTRITAAGDAGGLQTYTNAMRSQVVHYTQEEPNFGKASKRLYNLFRLTDQLEAAAYVRELFDEPGAQLYQVPGLLEAADVALRDPAAEIDRATVLKQIDLVTEQVKNATDGTDEAQIVGELARLRNDVLREPPGADWDEVLHAVRARCANIVSEYFRVRLFGYPPIREFVEGLK